MKPITKASHRLTAIGTALMSAVVLCTALPKNTASSASVDYPPVLLRISTSDNSSNLSISGTADKSACGTAAMQNTQNESWRFDYTGTDSNGCYYRIVNQASGRVLTPMGYSLTDGTDCVIFGNENEKSQYWYVKAVDKDSYGSDLHYQILNYADKNLALTNGNQITLQKYSGSSTQKWLLNAVGLQGFGGYCKDMNGKEKACNLGGTLGKVVEVSTLDELKAACTNNETCTIVITKNISKTGTYQKDGNGRYRFTDAKIYVNPNKTIIGSYGAHSLYNVFFQTFGENYGPGHDLIFRNIEISHDKELNSDNIWEFAYGSNYWIDHITFIGHDKVNGASTRTDDWDKFLNFKGNTDFITISDCKFGLHEYGVLLGYPTDTQETYDQYNDHPCVTLTSNFYQNCITLAPGLMRYGYFHSLNNYVINFDMGYTIYTACKLFSESNYFDAGTGKGSVVNDTVSSNDISSKYPGVYTDIGSTLIHSSYGLNGKTDPAPWRSGSPSHGSNNRYSIPFAQLQVWMAFAPLSFYRITPQQPKPLWG